MNCDDADEYMARAGHLQCNQRRRQPSSDSAATTLEGESTENEDDKNAQFNDEIWTQLLQRANYWHPRRQLGEFRLAMALQRRQHGPVLILLGGTSGCGKSTLASLLASRYVVFRSGYLYAHDLTHRCVSHQAGHQHRAVYGSRAGADAQFCRARGRADSVEVVLSGRRGALSVSVSGRWTQQQWQQ